MEIISSTFREQLTSNAQIMELLKASENCIAVKGLMAREREKHLANAGPLQ